MNDFYGKMGTIAIKLENFSWTNCDENNTYFLSTSH